MTMSVIVLSMSNWTTLLQLIFAQLTSMPVNETRFGVTLRSQATAQTLIRRSVAQNAGRLPASLDFASIYTTHMHMHPSCTSVCDDSSRPTIDCAQALSEWLYGGERTFDARPGRNMMAIGTRRSAV